MLRAARSIALSLAALVSASALAQSTQPAPQSLQEVSAALESLRASVAQLEAQQKAMYAAQRQQLKDDVLADLRKSDTTISYDEKAGRLVLRRGDSTVIPGVMLQMRNVTQTRREGKSASTDDFQNGFEISSILLSLEGTLGTKDLSYRLEGVYGPSTGTIVMSWAFIKYDINPQWSVRAGQFKSMLSAEYLVSNIRQMAADRSLLDNTLGGNSIGSIQGATLIYGGRDDANPVTVEFGVNDGPKSANTLFLDDANGLWGASARAEFKFAGKWSQLRTQTAAVSDDMIVLGLAADAAGIPGAQVYTVVADASFRLAKKLAVMPVGIVQVRDPSSGSSQTNYGAGILAGYMLTNQVELFARYDVVIFDKNQILNTVNLGDTFNEITIGANYYFNPDSPRLHGSKLTLDATYLPNGGGPTGAARASIPAGGRDRFLLRFQYQLQY